MWMLDVTDEYGKPRNTNIIDASLGCMMLHVAA